MTLYNECFTRIYYNTGIVDFVTLQSSKFVNLLSELVQCDI